MTRRVAVLLWAWLVLWLLPVGPAAALNIEQVRSPSGIVAWLVEDHGNPIISMSFGFHGGSALDPQDRNGLAKMVAGLLDEGAGELDSQTFQGKLEDLAISLGFSAGEDVFYGHLKTVTANRDTAFDLMRLALNQPRFDADAVERIRSQILTDLARQQQSPSHTVWQEFAKVVYPDHPYGRPSDGTPDSVKAISADDLRGWTGRRLGRDQLMIAVVGDVAPAELGLLLDQVFGPLPAQAAPIEVPEATVQGGGKVEVIHRTIPQSVVAFGQQGLKRDDPDWYAAYVLNYVLGGGGFSSRLMQEVRVKRGLAYGVSTSLVPHDHGALLVGSVATRNDRLAESLQVIHEVWRKVAENGLTAEELATAKTYLNGSFPLQMDSTGSIARLLLTIQLDRLGIDYLDRRAGLIDRVSLSDVQRVAKRLLDADRLATVVVGDPKGM